MSGYSHCTVCDTVGTFGEEHEGCSRSSMIGTMPITVQGRFVCGEAYQYDEPFLTAAPCDIEVDEAAEQDAAERAFLRGFGMGTWLTAMSPRYPTIRVQWGA